MFNVLSVFSKMLEHDIKNLKRKQKSASHIYLSAVLSQKKINSNIKIVNTSQYTLLICA